MQPADVDTFPVARRCACARPARRVAVIQRRLHGLIPIGTIDVHTCAGCLRTFRVHSVTSVLFTVFAALLVTGFGALMVAYPPGSAVGAEASNQIFGWGILAIGLLGWILPAIYVVQRSRAPHVAAH